MILPKPAENFAARDAHALPRRSDEPLVEVADQHLFDDIPRIVRAEQPPYVI